MNPLGSLSQDLRDALNADAELSDADGGLRDLIKEHRVIDGLSPPSVAQGTVGAAGATSALHPFPLGEYYQAPAIPGVSAAGAQQIPQQNLQQAPNAQQAQKRDYSKHRCHNCQEYGHIKATCKNPPQPRQDDKPAGAQKQRKQKGSDKPSGGVKKQQSERGGRSPYAIGKAVGAAVAAYFNEQGRHE